MDLQTELFELEKLNERHSNDELSIDETNALDARVDVFLEEIKDVINNTSTNNLYNIMTSDQWIVQEDLSGVDSSDYKSLARNALYEDFDHVIIGCKALLGIQDED